MSTVTLPSLYGIIGYPLNQTLSPLLHTTSFNDLDIASVLLPWPTPPEKISTFIDAFRLLNIRGCCVTIPHKQAVIPFLDKITEHAQKVGAVNLLYWEGEQLCGDNTDVLGFMVPLQVTPLAPELKKVLILGAGGAARAAIVGLHNLGYTDITIASVSTERPKALAKEFNLNTIDWDQRHTLMADIIINSTPLGMQGKFEDQTGYEAQWFKGKKGVAYDIVYTPYMTRFLQEAQDAGWTCISGRDMFLEQADAQFKTWTGKNLSENAKQAVINALTK